jgi:hypothetical protein
MRQTTDRQQPPLLSLTVMMSTYLAELTFRVWLIELAVSAVNYFVLINRVYEPRFGELRAHQIGMSTRILYIFVFAYFLLDSSNGYTTLETLYAGGFWLALVLAFEWVGSLILRRPVHEILIGWHINRGYMWPYVLLTYLFSPLLVGVVLHPGP